MLKEVDSNVQQAKQVLGTRTVVVGTGAQVEVMPNQEPCVGAAARLSRGSPVAHWNVERKFERYFME